MAGNPLSMLVACVWMSDVQSGCPKLLTNLFQRRHILVTVLVDDRHNSLMEFFLRAVKQRSFFEEYEQSITRWSSWQKIEPTVTVVKPYLYLGVQMIDADKCLANGDHFGLLAGFIERQDTDTFLCRIGVVPRNDACLCRMWVVQHVDAVASHSSCTAP